MKILHTADWHLGKRLEHFSRLPEQIQVLAEICEIADTENADAVLIAGDLFDTYNPASEAVDLFYKTLKRLSNDGKRLVVAIAGNHDSPERIEAPDPLARECGIIFSGFPFTRIPELKLESGLEIVKSEPGFIEALLPGCDVPLRILLTPYANEFRMKTYLSSGDEEEEMRQLLQKHWTDLAEAFCDENGVNVLVSHLYFMQKNGVPVEEPEDEKSILHLGGAQAIYSENVPAQIQYVALGHLHKNHIVDYRPCPMVYSGSPISYSFSEADQDKFVTMIDAFPGQPVSVRNVELVSGKRLLRFRAENMDEALEWLAETPDSLVEITVVTKTFLTAQDRKRLYQAHDGIVTILPETKQIGGEVENQHNIDLNQDTETLFIQYFKSKHNIEPNEELLELFKEIKAENTDA